MYCLHVARNYRQPLRVKIKDSELPRQVTTEDIDAHDFSSTRKAKLNEGREDN